MIHDTPQLEEMGRERECHTQPESVAPDDKHRCQTTSDKSPAGLTMAPAQEGAPNDNRKAALQYSAPPPNPALSSSFPVKLSTSVSPAANKIPLGRSARQKVDVQQWTQLLGPTDDDYDPHEQMNGHSAKKNATAGNARAGAQLKALSVPTASRNSDSDPSSKSAQHSRCKPRVSAPNTTVTTPSKAPSPDSSPATSRKPRRKSFSAARELTHYDLGDDAVPPWVSTTPKRLFRDASGSLATSGRPEDLVLPGES